MIVCGGLSSGRSKELDPETDYTVEYTNNVEAGTALVTVTCKGFYVGEAKKTFTIMPFDISGNTEFSLEAEEIEYTGVGLTPGVTVKRGEKVLAQNKDYMVQYKNNIEAGRAEVVIAGRGNYSGTVVKSFQIFHDITEGVKVSFVEDEPEYTGTAEPSQPELTELSQPGNMTTGTPSNPSSPSGIDDAEEEDGKQKEGDSEEKAGKVKNLKAKNDKKKSVTLTWSKVPNARSYEVQYSTSKKFKGKKIKVANKAIITLKGMKKKKTYYFKVRACTISNGKKVYGAWSAVKKAKIKK